MNYYFGRIPIVERDCVVPGCTKPKMGRGYCRPHYMRWYKTGDPIPPPKPSDVERFLARTKADPSTGCLLWTGPVNKRTGRGQTWFRGKNRYVHVISYLINHGELPLGLQVNHHCDVMICVNGDHVYAGTQADNMADMDARGRRANQNSRKTHCVNDHEFSADNTFIKTDGSRMCRECHRQRTRARRAA